MPSLAGASWSVHQIIERRNDAYDQWSRRQSLFPRSFYAVWLPIAQAVGPASRPIASRHCKYSA